MGGRKLEMRGRGGSGSRGGKQVAFGLPAKCNEGYLLALSCSPPWPQGIRAAWQMSVFPPLLSISADVPVLKHLGC